MSKNIIEKISQIATKNNLIRFYNYNLLIIIRDYLLESEDRRASWEREHIYIQQSKFEEEGERRAREDRV